MDSAVEKSVAIHPRAAGTIRIRASDAERSDTAAVIQSAVADGMLSFPEGEERLTAAYGATFRDEFGRLMEDLPPTEPTAARQSRFDAALSLRVAFQQLLSALVVMCTAIAATISRHRRSSIVAAVLILAALATAAAFGGFDLGQHGQPGGHRPDGPGGH